MLTSIIICAYNEEGTIKDIIERTNQIPIEKELIVVENGTLDKSRIIIDDLAKKLNFKVVYVDVNVGKGHGLRSGLKEAKGDIIAFQDADLELNPDEIVPLVEMIKNDQADVVFGSRFLDKKKTHIYRHYYYGNIFLTKVADLFLRRGITDIETCYKVFKRKLIDLNNLTSIRFEIEIELAFRLLKSKPLVRYKELPIQFTPRTTFEGKKIRWIDGLIALKKILQYGFTL